MFFLLQISCSLKDSKFLNSCSVSINLNVLKSRNVGLNNIEIEMPQANYESKEDLINLTQILGLIALLEKEKAFIQHLMKINQQLPITFEYLKM